MRLAIICVCLVVAVAVGTAVLVMQPRLASTVRMAVPERTNSAPLYVALERGFFEEQGIRVALAEPSTGKEGLAAMIAGDADIVASARQSLADPDWFLKMREGSGDQIRRCEFTNYCEALDQQHKQVTCKLWDREQLDEPGVTMASDGKRRLIAPSWLRRR